MQNVADRWASGRRPTILPDPRFIRSSVFLFQVRTAPCWMPVPASRVSTVAAAPTGTAATTVPVRLATRAATAVAMWMNVGCLACASMGVLVSTHKVPSAANARLATRGSSVRASLHHAPLLNVSTGAPAARQENSAMSVLACLVSEQLVGFVI